MKKSSVIAINHKRNTQAALASMNNDLDSIPPSKGDKLFCFTTAKTGKLRKFLDGKLDEMFQVDPNLNNKKGEKQMHHHMSPEVDKAFIRLMDDLCQWERATSRNGTLLYIPEHKDEPIVIGQGGKPQWSHSFEEQEVIEIVFKSAMLTRYGP